MKNFAIIGVGGYIAPRHLKAIKDTGNNMVSAYDKSDSVGIMDSYFPNAAFFTEQELFDRHNTRLIERGTNIDFVTVCTPNYLHDAHTRYGLRLGADVICEKPVVLNPWNIDALEKVEQTTGHKAYTILQLRLHDSIVALKKKIDEGPKDKIYDVDLTYITARGNWYYTSWKGNENKSGGIATNIGIHFYDMLSASQDNLRLCRVSKHGQCFLSQDQISTKAYRKNECRCWWRCRRSCFRCLSTRCSTSCLWR